MSTNREALSALAWVAVKSYIQHQNKLNRVGRRRKRAEHLAKHGVLTGRPREAVETSFVYVIGAKDHPVKIGFSKDVSSRLATIQTGCPTALCVYAHFEVPAHLAQTVERHAHEFLKAKRLKGEWFDVTGGEAQDAVAMSVAEVIQAAPFKEPERTETPA